MITVLGLKHIVARVIKDSITPQGIRLTTFELEYPRFVHSEFMTHRMLSKNSASSRAIPIDKMHDHIMAVPQEPIQWGKNQPGMQAKEVLGPAEEAHAVQIWDGARQSAISFSRALASIGLHKQIANRVTEPFMQMKVVCSGTDFRNFFWLRDHEDADPTIRELARCMKLAMDESVPVVLRPGEWHVPYVDTVREKDVFNYYDTSGKKITEQEAKVVSASCCAQVSYRRLDDSIDKAYAIFDRLINSVPVHASPVEHQATPIDLDKAANLTNGVWLEHGITHVDRNRMPYSGNFRGWAQFRQFIKNSSQPY